MAPRTRRAAVLQDGAEAQQLKHLEPEDRFYRIKGSRIHKPQTRGTGRGRGRAGRVRNVLYHREQQRPVKEPPTTAVQEARDATPFVSRTPTHLHACSDASLLFVSFANLQTTPDTNIITLNLADYFLFSSTNWNPELSYCRLHATTFYFASLLTGLRENTPAAIAEALGSESAFVRTLVDETNGADEEVVRKEVREVIGVTVADVEEGYGILFERKEELRGLVGGYADGIELLPKPRITLVHEEVEDANHAEEENFDLFEEDFDYTTKD